MQHLKPGRGPSAMNALGGIVGILFGIFWTIMAYSITRDAPGPVGTFFPLFGVLFVIIGIVNVAYNLYNTTQKDRLSVLDLTSSNEESDPLNDLVNGPASSRSTAEEPVEDKLRELAALRQKGLITDAEFAAQRQRILNSI